MNILVRRRWFTERSTIGDVLIDGSWQAFSLEDRIRAPGVKVKGETCIPAGTYRLIIDRSQRFGVDMPHVLDVPMFTGIRIHPGNTDKDTDGCPLLGTARVPDKVLQSRFAYERFLGMLRTALKNGAEVTITFENDNPPPSLLELADAS